MFPEFVYLASGSARRRVLLRQIGVSYRIIEAAVDETALEDERPLAYVSRVAAAKANAGWNAAAILTTLRYWQRTLRWFSTAASWENPATGVMRWICCSSYPAA